jgi:glycosyltransferase involved in cell wall biosynthesis
MPGLRICLLCADVARNALGRAYALARVLAREHDVQVVGPQFGASVWPPLAGLMEKHGIGLTAIRAHGYPRFFGAARRIWQAIQADVLYALKPYPTSYGLGLLYSQRNKTPLILDIDDWEVGAFQAMRRKQLLRAVVAAITSPNNYVWLRILYAQVQRAAAKTVSSSYLQRRFGGVLVPHGRDTAAMDPACVSGEAVRKEWRLSGRVVMFLGTPRVHKGIEDLVAAVGKLKRPEVTCVIVGAGDTEAAGATESDLAAGLVRVLPMQPFDRVPAFLAAADVVVIPQRQTPFSDAQMPAKLYDAMAMARPIISTEVSDIPQVLAGCGVVVPPGDVEALSGAIARLLDNEALARELGLAAREKCVREFSWDSMQITLREVIDGVSLKSGVSPSGRSIAGRGG